MRYVLLFILSIIIATTDVRAQGDASCAFDYVVEAGLVSETFTELTPGLSDNEEFGDGMRRILPNVKRVFFKKEGRYVALVGWAELPEEFSKFSELQVRGYFKETSEYGKRAIYPKASVSLRFAETLPFTAFFLLDYFDRGTRFRDIGMDVLASPVCILSVKFTGPNVNEYAHVWDLFDEELERIRAVVSDKEEPWHFSKEGARFSFFGILNTAIYLGIAVAIALLAFFGLRWRFRIEPGKAAWRYSTIIAVIATFSISVTVYANETFRGTPTLPYESVLIYLVVLTVHLAVLIMRTAPLILAAISLMLGTFATRGVYAATGWLAVPTGPELVGITVGLLLLIYVVWGTLRRKLEAQS